MCVCVLFLDFYFKNYQLFTLNIFLKTNSNLKIKICSISGLSSLSANSQVILFTRHEIVNISVFLIR